MDSEVRVLAVSRYDIPGENGRPPVRGTKIKYLGDQRNEPDYRGCTVMDVNGSYELFERFAPEKLPGLYRLQFGQKMSQKKAVLVVKDAAYSKPA